MTLMTRIIAPWELPAHTQVWTVDGPIGWPLPPEHTYECGCTDKDTRFDCWFHMRERKHK